jgi:hypothetical protein
LARFTIRATSGSTWLPEFFLAWIADRTIADPAETAARYRPSISASIHM